MPARSGHQWLRTQAASLVSCGFESGFQRRARHSSSAIRLQHGKASDSPKSLRPCGGKASILARMINTRKLFPGAVLAPSHGLSVGVHEDTVSTSLLNQFTFFPAISHTLSARVGSHCSWATRGDGESACTNRSASHSFGRKASQNRARSSLTAPSLYMPKPSMP